MLDALLRQILCLLEPIGLVWLGLLALTAALWWKGQRRFACAAGALALFITVVGSSPVPAWLLGSLEKPYAGVALAALPQADAIVLLGGGASFSRHEASHTHLTSSGDRLVMAHALFKMGKAPVLALGGNVAKLDGVPRLEGELLRDLFTGWGIPIDAMIPLRASGDTHDEAIHTRALATERGWRRVLLVTSANHLRRATAAFRAQGLEVIPAPCNFISGLGAAPEPFRISVPRADGFAQVATWLHEQAGWFIYRQRGWITE